MKKTVQISLLLLIIISCKAQSPIINIEDNEGERTQGIYYKDSNNLLNTYVGTYLLTDNGITFKIILQKKIMSYDGRIYEDLIVGGYQFIQNGTEKVNTLNDLNLPYINQYQSSNLYGNMILKSSSPGCYDCSANEKRLNLTLKDIVSEATADMVVGKTTVGNQQAIKISFGWNYSVHVAGTPNLLPASIPGGEYVLIKQ